MLLAFCRGAGIRQPQMEWSSPKMQPLNNCLLSTHNDQHTSCLRNLYLACLLKSEQPWPAALDCAQPLGCLPLWFVLGFKRRCYVNGKALYRREMVGVAIITMITRDLLGLLGRCQPSQPPTQSQQKQQVAPECGEERFWRESREEESAWAKFQRLSYSTRSLSSLSAGWLWCPGGLCLLSSYTHALV